MLVFHLMALAMNQDGFKSLESLCKEFVWGFGDQGNPRVPLVAWDTITKLTSKGGLDFSSFQDHAILLKLWCATQLVQGADIAWVAMAGMPSLRTPVYAEFQLL